VTTGASPNTPYPGNAGWAGPAWYLTGGSDFNAISFVARMIIAGRTHAALVQVKSCTNNGSVSPIGVVSVNPLVGQVDGFGNVVSHSIVYNLPYQRIQGGSSAVILDPVVGDIGLAVICDRDSSIAKSTGAQSAPGSLRQNNWADGMYLGAFISTIAPTQFVQFNASGVTVTTPNTFTVNAANIVINGNVATTGTLTNNGKSVGGSHSHSGVQTGGSDTGPPI